MQLRLDSTTQHGGRFYQQWTITDISGEHRVVSDSEWGSVVIEEGGKRIYDVAGTPVCAGQIVGCTIAMDPMEDMESRAIDAAWLAKVIESGARADCLADCP